MNLLIYAVDRKAPMHKAALAWLEQSLSSGEEIRLPWAVILAFVRIVTRHGWSARPLSIDSAFSFVASWLNHPSVSIAHPGPEHAHILLRLLQQVGTAGNLTSDAHLAALAIEHDAELASADNDFSRFHGLRWKNPLQRPLQ
ncbi:MAG: type II toxin-antitoxin system VapC family toxin [Acidobacteriota bacterium]